MVCPTLGSTTSLRTSSAPPNATITLLSSIGFSISKRLPSASLPVYPRPSSRASRGKGGGVGFRYVCARCKSSRRATLSLPPAANRGAATMPSCMSKRSIMPVFFSSANKWPVVVDEFPAKPTTSNPAHATRPSSGSSRNVVRCKPRSYEIAAPSPNRKTRFRTGTDSNRAV